MSNTYTVTKQNALTMLQTIYARVTKALDAGSVVIELKREKRSVDQNSLLWAVLTDIADQVIWHGEKLSPTDWKHILSAAWKGQRVLPGIDGSLVVFGQSTSKLNKADFSELIEVIYAFGSEQGVKWSASSADVFEGYRNAT